MSTPAKLQYGETIREFLGKVATYYADPQSDRWLQLGDKLARFHEDRGQIDHAIEYWTMATPAPNHLLDSFRVQSMLKSPTIGHRDMLAGQREWAQRHAVSLPDDEFVVFAPYDGNRKIRVGYACCWFDSSTIRGQGIPFIAEHDRFRFSVVGYSLGMCDNSITRHFDDFVDVQGMSDVDFAKRVRSDEIDVLVEFTGFSPLHRFGAMGARCAPVQISYLNHAGTSGVENVDYVLADDLAAPQGIDQYFTETIYRLPHTFFCFNYDWDEFPIVKPPPHLSKGYTTFGCFGSQSKVNDGVVKIWADLLHAVPRSKLFLRNMGLNSRENRKFMERRFARWGIPSSRLRLQPGGNREEIKENYNEVDISLDTWPYCGGNTIAESQWMGVPVVSLKGSTFPASYGASLLNASGCSDLIAHSPAEYIQIAADLAADSTRIVHYRNNLRDMMVRFGFGDARRFAGDMEVAYTKMMERAFGLPTEQPTPAKVSG
jgi:predicted O-linked N-acetylglucosamine transferase (SPINDLY family)